jgi:hypothetical protein
MTGIELNREDLMARSESNVDNIITLNEVMDKLDSWGQDFASDLVTQFKNRGYLSEKQASWVLKLIDRVEGAEPIYGDFKAVLVMLQIAGANDKGNALKAPKIRLMTKGGRFVQLNFNPEESSKAKVFVDGWQGHGYRKYAGAIEDNVMKPYSSDRMDDDVKLTLQEFSLNPVKAAKAASNLLGCCPFCGGRLTDPRSKHAGYGQTCAKNYGLPWGAK